MVLANFHNIDAFEQLANKAWFWLRFWTPKLRKIGKKWYWKHVVFFTSIFLRLFSDFFRLFAILAWFWEALGPPKINKELKNSCLGRFWSAFSFEGGLWGGFGRIFGDFWMDIGSIIGKILGWLSNDYKHCRLQNLLWWLGRRGADQWMDGWMGLG